MADTHIKTLSQAVIVFIGTHRLMDGHGDGTKVVHFTLIKLHHVDAENTAPISRFIDMALFIGSPESVSHDCVERQLYVWTLLPVMQDLVAKPIVGFVHFGRGGRLWEKSTWRGVSGD